MAKVALAQLGKRGREEDSSNEDEIDARNFDSLKWRQELQRATKRRKIEDTTEEEMSTAKKDDDDETCLNTGQRLYPKVHCKISMRKNRRIEDDDDVVVEAETLQKWIWNSEVGLADS